MGIGTVQAGTIYVSTAGSDGNDGLSWGTAKKTVRAGLNPAVAGNQVWVAAGTYVERVALKAGVGLYGGFAGSETDLAQRNWVANRTILDGNQAGCVVTGPLGATSSTRIDGFTITNGSASYGGGLFIYYYSSLTIANTIIAFNSSGIYKTPSPAPSLRYNCVYGNVAYNFSGLPDPTGTKGNISADPLFVDPSTGDYRLQGGSPCIDAGNNANVPADAADLNGDGNTTEPLPFDLAGASRFVDDPTAPDTGAGTAPIVDIGAYERQHLLGDVNDDWLVDVVDLLGVVYAFGTVAGDSAYDPACDFNHNDAVDVVDLLMLVDNFGK
jgi:hypothetical protein